MITLKDNNISKAFSNIIADETLKINTFDAITSKLKRKQRVTYKHYLALVASIILIIGAFFGGYRFYYTEAYAISVDSDTSVEISINKFGKVINETYFDTETNNLCLENMNYFDAVNKICSNTPSSPISIDVLSENDQNKVVDELKNNISKNDINANIHCSNSDLREDAHAEGLSVGKYRAILEIIEQNPEMTLDELIDVPMHDLKPHKKYNSKGQQRNHRERNGKSH